MENKMEKKVPNWENFEMPECEFCARVCGTCSNSVQVGFSRLYCNYQRRDVGGSDPACDAYC